jgi:hypothetical protein
MPRGRGSVKEIAADFSPTLWSALAQEIAESGAGIDQSSMSSPFTCNVLTSRQERSAVGFIGVL